MRFRRSIRLFWAGGSKGVVNYGDAISQPILEILLGRPVVFAKPASADLVAAGSVFKSFVDTVWRRPLSMRFSPLFVWGSGSLSLGALKSARFDAPGLRIGAVRGPKTRVAIGAPDDLPLGDPGLFAALLIEGARPDPSTTIGLVPHKDDLGQVELADAVKRLPDARIIDLTVADLSETTRQIASCNFVLTSSLHGLIVADALRVPSVYIARTNGRRECEYKFADYFASVGREIASPVALGAVSSLADIERSARVADETKISKRLEELNGALRAAF